MLSGPGQAVIGADSDIVRRLELRTIDLESLAAWGSPAFFE
jgi:hypothetical protein